jgi:hypothetical protein
VKHLAPLILGGKITGKNGKKKDKTKKKQNRKLGKSFESRW